MNRTDRASLERLAALLGPRAYLDRSLAPYSGVGIGGSADLLFIAQSRAEVVRAVELARQHSVRWRVFGGLTNILLPDGGLRGLIILNQARAAEFRDEYRLWVEAGAPVVKVAREAVRRGWGGLTWAVGLPGTFGGAVVNNAGAFGGEIADSLISAEVLGPSGRVEEVGVAWFDFSYRFSRLKGGGGDYVVLTATFQLAQRDTAHLEAKAREYTERRQRTQPPGKTLGSTFKNPPGDHAGRLIDAAGLKGVRRGGCVISTQHANFIINDGSGTAADYRALIELAQTTVFEQAKIQLEPEIEILPEELLDSVGRQCACGIGIGGIT